MPFIALHLYKDEDEDNIIKEFLLTFFSISLALWLILNIAFFCTIDLSFANTFIGRQTASQCCVMNYQESDDDSQKFWWGFGSRVSYTKSIREEVRTWVGENIAGWIEEKPDWFNVDLIPNDMLPDEVLESAGGAAGRRMRSVVSLRELVQA